ncbi:MAG: 30S ribosomal protein S3 [Candidatus Aenigmatarchaeota archaeon]
MSIERKFIKDGIMLTEISEYLKKQFTRADYSHIEVQKTPLGTRIVVYANKPGIIIGKSGKQIKDVTAYLQAKFNLDNPQIDVKTIANPDMDAQIVARQMATSIERGFNHKRIANLTLKRVMDAGAVGVALRLAGKLGGEKSRFEKFSTGYVQHSGETSERLVLKGFAEASLRGGKVGIQVRIMTAMSNEDKIPKEKKSKELEADQKPASDGKL